MSDINKSQNDTAFVHAGSTGVNAASEEGAVLYGLLAEFVSIDDFLEAAAIVRDHDYTRWDVHSPFPVHGMGRIIGGPAIGRLSTRLSVIVLLTGLCGLFGGLFLVWWTNATSWSVPHAIRGYEFIIAGKPIFSLPANIPVIFETTVLLAAFGATFGMLALNGLPRLFHPLLASERFARVTQDRFFISIEAADPKFDRMKTVELLLGAKATVVEEIPA